MTLALWRSPLARALHRNRSLPYARYLQLATVRLDGKPANRTVVFRGFLENTNQLTFVTDQRSQKIDQIQHQAWAEICWYFPTTREQFRLLGKLTRVGPENTDTKLSQARLRLWKDLSDAARLQFAWPEPGQLRSPTELFDGPAPDPLQPLSNFCLLLLDPTEVDHLELRGEPQNRYRYRQDQDSHWLIESINP
jgi:PPOX class probable FMN-dependent enzyme